MLAELGITAREVDVLVLVAGGATNREVAERLFISLRTVDKHVERLLQKTGATRRGPGGDRPRRRALGYVAAAH